MGWDQERQCWSMPSRRTSTADRRSRRSRCQVLNPDGDLRGPRVRRSPDRRLGEGLAGEVGAEDRLQVLAGLLAPPRDQLLAVGASVPVDGRPGGDEVPDLLVPDLAAELVPHDGGGVVDREAPGAVV